MTALTATHNLLEDLKNTSFTHELVIPNELLAKAAELVAMLEGLSDA